MSIWNLRRRSDEKEKPAPKGRRAPNGLPGKNLEEKGPNRDSFNEEVDAFTRLYRKPLKKLAE